MTNLIERPTRRPISASAFTVFDWYFIDGEVQQVMPALIEHVFSETIPSFDIVPIPLTADILLANGFEKLGSRNSERYKLWKSQEEIIWAEADGKYFLFYISMGYGTWDDIMIEYVHELQHLLRTAGFVDLADDWKLEEGGN